MVVTPILQNPVSATQNADELRKLADDARNKTQSITAPAPTSNVTGGAQGTNISAQALGPSVRVDISNQARDAVKSRENSGSVAQESKNTQVKTQGISIKA